MSIQFQTSGTFPEFQQNKQSPRWFLVGGSSSPLFPSFPRRCLSISFGASRVSFLRSCGASFWGRDGRRQRGQVSGRIRSMFPSRLSSGTQSAISRDNYLATTSQCHRQVLLVRCSALHDLCFCWLVVEAVVLVGWLDEDR